MDPVELCDHVLAGAEVQVVGVAEDDRRAERAELVGIDHLHRRLRADRHECRRRHVAVVRAKHAGARSAVASGHGEVSVHRTSIASPNE